MFIVVMFIRMSVMMSVVLWLILLFRWLKMILLMGCVVKFVYNVMNDSSVVMFGFSVLEKNILLKISVVVRL